MSFGLSDKRTADKEKYSMTTQQILPPLPGNLPSQPQTASLTAKADAWRKAFEQEQNGILKDTRSVKFGESMPAFTADAGGRQTNAEQLPGSASQISEGKRPAPASAKAGLVVADSSPTVASDAAGLSQPRSLSTHALVSLQLTQQVQAHRSAQLSPNMELASVIALLESHYRQKWPFKNVHVVHTGDGVSIWIRDSTFQNEEQVQSMAERIQQAVQEDGQQLISLVLNGKTIIG
ncbi:hypothetical protein EDC30_10318 [Paucimonas lemoignei]|uniref:Uncharacterized protein n=1 Tax=Paucimonas lemoignei TaxID=29443 RepID=A0A4R3HWQ8_PAULE|nr:hypothetical protein [Paucimonas lemoignei]TCS37726.1 hypothetical protein EDC30_10318 [Paucimonas lemoignei]